MMLLLHWYVSYKFIKLSSTYYNKRKPHHEHTAPAHYCHLKLITSHCMTNGNSLWWSSTKCFNLIYNEYYKYTVSCWTHKHSYNPSHKTAAFTRAECFTVPGMISHHLDNNHNEDKLHCWPDEINIVALQVFGWPVDTSWGILNEASVAKIKENAYEPSKYSQLVPNHLK